MFLPKSVLIACFSLLSFAAMPVWADTPEKKGDEQKTIHVSIPPTIGEAEKTYQEAVKSLSKEQVEKLEALSKDAARSADLDMQGIYTGKEVKYCSSLPETAIAKDPVGYRAKLGIFRNKLEAKKSVMKEEDRRKMAAEAPFINEQILLGHYNYSSVLMSTIGTQLAEVAEATGGFSKTNCAETAKKLDDAFTAGSALIRKIDETSGELVAQMQAKAEAGDPESMLSLGMLQMMGHGMERDREKGLVWLTKAAETNYPRAQYMLGLAVGTSMYGETPDKEKAKYWLGKAAAQGFKKAEYLLKSIDNEKPEDSLEIVQKKAAEGDAGAQYDLSTNYRKGLRGLPQDDQETMKWMILAAGQGYPLAQSDIALIVLTQGRPDEAIAWMTSAAGHGVTNSQLELADIYLEGRVLPKNVPEAIFWYKQAAKTGEPRAVEALKQLGVTP